MLGEQNEPAPKGRLAYEMQNATIAKINFLNWLDKVV